MARIVLIIVYQCVNSVQQKKFCQNIQNIRRVFTKSAFWKRLPELRLADYSQKTVGSIVVALERDRIV